MDTKLKHVEGNAIQKPISPLVYACLHIVIWTRLIESTKTTSMEDVSTGVLEKKKNI